MHPCHVSQPDWEQTACFWGLRCVSSSMWRKRLISEQHREKLHHSIQDDSCHHGNQSPSMVPEEFLERKLREEYLKLKSSMSQQVSRWGQEAAFWKQISRLKLSDFQLRPLLPGDCSTSVCWETGSITLKCYSALIFILHPLVFTQKTQTLQFIGIFCYKSNTNKS